MIQPAKYFFTELIGWIIIHQEERNFGYADQADYGIQGGKNTMSEKLADAAWRK